MEQEMETARVQVGSGSSCFDEGCRARASCLYGRRRNSRGQCCCCVPWETAFGAASVNLLAVCLPLPS